MGSINFGDVGEAPPVVAQAAGAPLAYVAATVTRLRTEGVLLPSGSPVRSVAEPRLLADRTDVVSNRPYYFSSLKYADRNADVLRIVRRSEIPSSR